MTVRFKALWDLFIAELMKFGAVGGLAFLVNAAVVWVLMSTVLHDGHLKAKAIATVVATIFSWLANRYWTFRDKRQADTKREAWQFLVANVIGLSIELSCLGVSVYVLGLTSELASFISGTIIGTILGTVFRYLAYRFWVYAKPLDSEPGFAPSTASEMAAITGSLPVVGQDRARRRTGSTAHGTPGAPEPAMGDDRQGPEAEASDLSSR
ncbi:MAG: GtrA family protein [Micrococcales bacterium]|nr:GtrA family protein [Micrococcales bacterium]